MHNLKSIPHVGKRLPMFRLCSAPVQSSMQQGWFERSCRQMYCSAAGSYISAFWANQMIDLKKAWNYPRNTKPRFPTAYCKIRDTQFFASTTAVFWKEAQRGDGWLTVSALLVADWMYSFEHGPLQEGHGLRSHAGGIRRKVSTARSCAGTVFHSPGHSLGIVSQRVEKVFSPRWVSFQNFIKFWKL